MAPKKDEIVGGKYVVKEGELVIVLVGYSHLDPKVYGEDAHEFRPERMLDENFDRLNKEFPNAWKPFGNGTRGCIGRPFAWQEALLVIAMLLQNFDFEFDDPNYTLALKQTLTVKPANFKVRAIPRDGLRATELGHRLAGTTAPVKSGPAATKNAASAASTDAGEPMSIYYGSNSGTCQSMAERLAANAFSHGFRARTVDGLDNATDNLPKNEPVVIITASYEGQPPDNAARFVSWLESLRNGEQSLREVSYAVFGCGHHDWASTFHRIPRLVDSSLAKHGGTQIASLGLTDVAAGNEMTDFESWEDDVLWPALTTKYNTTTTEGPALSVEITSPRKSTLHQDLEEATVLATATLTSSDAPIRKQYMEIQLPPSMTYKAGDYLAVLPVNPRDQVHRVLRHFHLPWDAHLTISAKALTYLPHNVSLPAIDIFASYVEVAQPATKRNILALADATTDLESKSNLQTLATNDALYASEITAKRLSVLDLLEQNPNITLPISAFLRMLPPMRVRQYSIGSSPLWSPDRVVLTYSVPEEPCLSDRTAAGTVEGEEKRHVGVATSYLSSLRQGDVLHVSVHPSHAAFHLPLDAEKTPILMIAAGTGIAPFRAFIQERAEMLNTGRKIAPAILYFGCREPGKDDLYRGELEKWEAAGVVSVRRAYSRQTEASEGCRYVQDRLWREREEVMGLWEAGVRVYICGSRAVGASAKEVLVEMFLDKERKEGMERSREEVRRWFEGLKNVRWAMDVFD